MKTRMTLGRAGRWLAIAIVGVPLAAACNNSNLAGLNITGAGAGMLGGQGGNTPCGFSWVGGPSCDACSQESCCSEWSACAQNSACTVLVSCASDCADGDTACLNTCATNAGSAAVDIYESGFNCLQANCSSPCFGAGGTGGAPAAGPTTSNTATDGTSSTTSTTSGGGTCLNPGQAESQCNTDADCCSNYCRGCFCQGSPKNGDACEALQCHWGDCQNNVCSCNPVGSSCQSDHDCCTSNCDGNGQCSDGLITEGSPCAENRWCYSGLCTSGRCASFWCADTQGGGLHYSDPCGSDAQCNSNVCSDSGNCSCIENGGSCTDDWNCCHSGCVGGTCE